MNLLKKILPIFVKDLFKKIIIKQYKKIEFQNNSETEKPYYCPVCNKPVTHFLPLDELYIKNFDDYGFVHSIFQLEMLNVLQYSCPECYSEDRTRLYAIYLKNILAKNDTNKTFKFLDIAPDFCLKKVITSFSNIEYRSADLYMKGVDDIIDITDMSLYKDETFDYILCSHVLEHVDKEKQAIREIYRVLKKDGFAIIMVPILLSLQEDLENQELSSEAERWKYFGQNDHIRLHSKTGFLTKLQEVGFIVEQLNESYFGKDVFNKHGINSRSVLYISKKQ
jgi:SAM-dependent methyltransferase